MYDYRSMIIGINQICFCLKVVVLPEAQSSGVAIVQFVTSYILCFEGYTVLFLKLYD